MRYWDAKGLFTCWDAGWSGGNAGTTHLMVAVHHSGWEYLCLARPEHWETVTEKLTPTDDPVVMPHTDQPTCEVCKHLVSENLKSSLTKANWPITWKRIT